jgi:Protein of unknown function (DUF559)
MGIPVTSIERTLRDIAGRLDARQLERAIVAADRSGRLRWPQLARQLTGGGAPRGAGRLRRVAELVDPQAVEARSGLEVDFLALCREAGLPRPCVNVLVEGYLVDFFWPERRVVVETDSYAHHGDRPAFESDRERTIALNGAGYKVHRVTERMLERDPAPFLNLVRCSLRPPS